MSADDVREERRTQRTEAHVEPSTLPLGQMLAEIPAATLDALRQQILLDHPLHWARVLSDSMSPLIRTDDLVIIQRCPPERLRFGDVMAFRTPAGWVIHRMIGRRRRGQERYLLEKPDAGSRASLVPAGEVLGRVSRLRRSQGAVDLLAGSGRRLQVILGVYSAAAYLAGRVAARLGLPPGLCGLLVRLGRCCAGPLEVAIRALSERQRAEA